MNLELKGDKTWLSGHSRYEMWCGVDKRTVERMPSDEETLC